MLSDASPEGPTEHGAFLRTEPVEQLGDALCVCCPAVASVSGSVAPPEAEQVHGDGAMVPREEVDRGRPGVVEVAREAVDEHDGGA